MIGKILRRMIAAVAVLAIGLGVTAGTASAAADTPSYTASISSVTFASPVTLVGLKATRTIGVRDWWW